MTLEEAIIHCKEKACGNTQCALEHRQLAEWLEELQQYRKNAGKEESKMKAPNKIYVPILPRTENSRISEHCVGTAWNNKEHITIPDIEEYIRKDALLEWANARKSGLSSGESFVAGERKMLKEVLEKLNSM